MLLQKRLEPIVMMVGIRSECRSKRMQQKVIEWCPIICTHAKMPPDTCWLETERMDSTAHKGVK